MSMDTLDSRTIGLLRALHMELSVCPFSQNPSMLSKGTDSKSISLVDGLLQVLEWHGSNEVSISECAQLYEQWVITKNDGATIEQQLDLFSYNSLIDISQLLEEILRRNQLNAGNLSNMLNTLNGILNHHLIESFHTTQVDLDDIEEIFMLLDSEGVGIVGWDSIVFFYMSLIKAGYATRPKDQKQFVSGFMKILHSIPHYQGSVSVRGIKQYVLMSESHNGLLQACKEVLLKVEQKSNFQKGSDEGSYQDKYKDEDNNDGSGDTDLGSFSKPFKLAFIETMSTLHRKGLITEEDLSTDQLLNRLSCRLQEFYEEIIEEVVSSWEKSSQSVIFLSKKNKQNEQQLLQSSTRQEDVFQETIQLFPQILHGYIKQAVQTYFDAFQLIKPEIHSQNNTEDKKNYDIQQDKTPTQEHQQSISRQSSIQSSSAVINYHNHQQKQQQHHQIPQIQHNHNNDTRSTSRTRSATSTSTSTQNLSMQGGYSQQNKRITSYISVSSKVAKSNEDVLNQTPNIKQNKFQQGSYMQMKNKQNQLKKTENEQQQQQQQQRSQSPIASSQQLRISQGSYVHRSKTSTNQVKEPTRPGQNYQQQFTSKDDTKRTSNHTTNFNNPNINPKNQQYESTIYSIELTNSTNTLQRSNYSKLNHTENDGSTEYYNRQESIEFKEIQSCSPIPPSASPNLLSQSSSQSLSYQRQLRSKSPIEKQNRSSNNYQDKRQNSNSYKSPLNRQSVQQQQQQLQHRQSQNTPGQVKNAQTDSIIKKDQNQSGIKHYSTNNTQQQQQQQQQQEQTIKVQKKQQQYHSSKSPAPLVRTTNNIKNYSTNYQHCSNTSPMIKKTQKDNSQLQLNQNNIKQKEPQRNRRSSKSPLLRSSLTEDQNTKGLVQHIQKEVDLNNDGDNEYPTDQHRQNNNIYYSIYDENIKTNHNSSTSQQQKTHNQNPCMHNTYQTTTVADHTPSKSPDLLQKSEDKTLGSSKSLWTPIQVRLKLNATPSEAQRTVCIDRQSQNGNYCSTNKTNEKDKKYKNSIGSLNDDDEDDDSKDNNYHHNQNNQQIKNQSSDYHSQHRYHNTEIQNIHSSKQQIQQAPQSSTKQNGQERMSTNSKSPVILKRSVTQLNQNKRIESFEVVMQRLESKNGFPKQQLYNEIKKRPFH